MRSFPALHFDVAKTFLSRSREEKKKEKRKKRKKKKQVQEKRCDLLGSIFNTFLYIFIFTLAGRWKNNATGKCQQQKIYLKHQLLSLSLSLSLWVSLTLSPNLNKLTPLCVEIWIIKPCLLQMTAPSFTLGTPALLLNYFPWKNKLSPNPSFYTHNAPNKLCAL